MALGLCTDGQELHVRSPTTVAAKVNTVCRSPDRGKILGRRTIDHSLSHNFRYHAYDTFATKLPLNINTAFYTSNTQCRGTSTPGGLHDQEISS